MKTQKELKEMPDFRGKMYGERKNKKWIDYL